MLHLLEQKTSQQRAHQKLCPPPPWRAGTISKAAVAANSSEAGAVTFTSVTVLNRAVLPSTTINGNLEVKGRVAGDLSASVPANLTVTSLTVSGDVVAGSLAVQRGTALGTQLAPGQVALTVQTVAAADQLRVGRNATLGRLEVERVTALHGNVEVGSEDGVAHLVVSGGVHGKQLGLHAGAGVAGLRRRQPLAARASINRASAAHFRFHLSAVHRAARRSLWVTGNATVYGDAGVTGMHRQH